MRKSEEGTTLVSLTITIIIMLIFASVLISATSGIDEWEEAIDGTENMYEENKAEVEEKIDNIDRKWSNVLNKKTIDNVIY